MDHEEHLNTMGHWSNENDNAHLGEQQRDVSDTLHRELPINHIKAVKSYGDYSGDLNRHLIARHKKQEEHISHFEKERHKEITKHLDHATNNPIGHDVHLYSGIGFNPHSLKKKKGHVFLPAFTSMTHDKSIARDFAASHQRRTDSSEGHILHLHMKSEDKATHISKYSPFGFEQETILPRKTLIKIHHLPEIHSDSQGNKTHIWHGKIVHQPDNTKDKYFHPESDKFSDKDDELLKKLHENVSKYSTYTDDNHKYSPHGDHIASSERWESLNDNDHLGKNSTEIANKLKEKSPDLTTEQHIAVQQYSDYSEDLNKELVNKHNAKIRTPTHNVDGIKVPHLDAATDHPIGHHLSLYSGLGFNPKILKKKKGHVFLPAYTSLSHDKTIARRFSHPLPAEEYNTHGQRDKHILHLHIKPEDKGIHISHRVHRQREFETILPRKTLIKIHHLPEIHDDGFTTHKIWHGHIVKQGDIP